MVVLDCPKEVRKRIRCSYL